MLFTKEELALPTNVDRDVIVMLGFLAYYPYYLSITDIENYCKQLKIRKIAYKEICFYLERGTEWFNNYYTLKDEYIFPVIFNILSKYSSHISRYKEIHYYSDKLVYWDLASKIIPVDNYTQSDCKNFSDNRYLDNKAFDYYFYNPKFWPVFGALPLDFFCKIINIKIDNTCMNEYIDFDMHGIINIIDFYEKENNCSLESWKDKVKAVQFTIDAKSPDFQNHKNEWTLAVEAIENLYKGDTDTAYKLFQDSLRIYNKTRSEKNYYDNPIFTFYLSLCYAKLNKVEARKKSVILLNKDIIASLSIYWPSYAVNKFICLNSSLEFTGRQMNLPYCQSLKFLVNLIRHYFKIQDWSKFGLTNSNIDSIKPKSILLRHELSSYLLNCKEPSAYELLGGNPILSSIKPKADWEKIIDDMSDLLPKQEVKTESKDEASSRIIYVFGKNGPCDIREQKKKKSGEWTNGTHLTYSSFSSGKLKILDSRDESIIQENSRYNPRGLELWPYDIMPKMIGADKVFFEDSDKGKLEPIRITEEKAYFSVNKDKNGDFIFRNNLLGHKINKIIVHKNSDTDYSVFRLTDIEVSILLTISRINSFPPDSESKLISFFEKLNGIVEVHSPLIKGGSLLEKIKGDSTIFLQFKPSNQATYFLKIIARPLKGGKVNLVPGKGNSTIFDSLDGKRLQIERDLKNETKNYEVLTDFLYTLNNSEETESGKWALDPQDMLEVINFARENKDTFSVEWPAGQSVKVKTKLTSSMVSASIKHKESWFEMEGQVKIDQNSVLTLQQLLTLFNENRNGKFIQLSEDEFIILEESLKNQLQKLSDIATTNNKRIPVFQVGAIAELLTEDDSFLKTDKKFKELELKMIEASKLDPDVPATLNAELRDYQTEGFKWMVRLSSWGAGACLADDMGLGKTIQAISLMLYRKGPYLIVAPASVVLNWVSEIYKFAPTLNPVVLNETDSRTDVIDNATEGDVILCSYGILQREEDTISKKQWDLVCLDEAHTIKNHGTKTSAAAMKIKADAKLALTGTPIQNNLSELWNIFQFLNPGLLGSYEAFSKRFNMSSDNKGNMRRLKAMIQPFMLRRRKTDVIEELPDKTEVRRMIELSKAETAAYEAIRESTEQALLSSNKVDVSILAQITKLRQAACSMKLIEKSWPQDSSKEEYAVDILSEIIDGGNRVLVFSQFTSFLTMVRDKFATTTDNKIPFLYLDGSVPIRKREEMVNKFQRGEAKVFFISLKAGGLGLNLTGANYVVHLDPWWNPAIEEQATDRAHRIGQKQNVTVYHLLSSHTIEEKILRLHKNKKDIADFLMEGTNVAHNLSLEDLRALVNID